MKERRDFIKKTLLGAGTLVLPSIQNANAKPKKLQLGIISNTLNSAFEKDYKSALKEIAKIGYTHIESSIPKAAKSAAEFKAALDEAGLRSIGIGANMSKLLKNVGPFIETAQELSSEYIICFYPWTSSIENLSIDQVMKTAENINQVGKQIKQAGFRFAWHNHDKEFVDIDHRQAFDIILENTDPEYSTVELDWFWATMGGRDPIDIFKKYPGRFELAHLRDMHNSRHGGSACPGQGLIDFKPIIKAAKNFGGIKHFIVEHPAKDSIECARVSYEYLSKIM